MVRGVVAARGHAAPLARRAIGRDRAVLDDVVPLAIANAAAPLECRVARDGGVDDGWS